MQDSSENRRLIVIGGCLVPVIIVIVITMGIFIWYVFYHDLNNEDGGEVEIHQPATELVSAPQHQHYA